MQHQHLLSTSKKAHRYTRTNILAMVLLAILAVITLYQLTPSGVRAANNGPIIHWNSRMIYQGQNNGFPWGPVGENASVEGVNYLPNLQLRLVLAQGDSNSNPATCKMAVATVDTVTTNSSGQFNQNFSWPVAAGQVNQEYSICALLAANGNVISHQDDGPFTVLSSNPPAINISTSTVTAGNTVIVTGQNWVPPQQVNVVIAQCADCSTPAVANGTPGSTGLNSGSFSITLTIPASARTGSYVVNAFTSSGLDANSTSGARSLTINGLAPTPSATVAPTTTPSPTTTTTATVTTSPTTTSTMTPTSTNASASNNSGDNGNSGLIIGLVISIVLVLLAVAAVILFIYMQRASKRRASPGGPPPNYSQTAPPAPGMSLSNYAYPTQLDKPGMPSNGSSPTYVYPAQQGTYILPPNNLFDSPTQFVQESGSLPGYGRPAMPPNNYGQLGGNGAPACMNCGRLLSPGDVRCAGCGMPGGAQNPNAPYWGH